MFGWLFKEKVVQISVSIDYNGRDLIEKDVVLALTNKGRVFRRCVWARHGTPEMQVGWVELPTPMQGRNYTKPQ